MRNWVFIEVRNGIAIRLSLSLSRKIVRSYGTLKSKPIYQIETNKPDIVFLDKIMRKCYIIDVACPFDTRVCAKEKEKIDKYQDLKREITRIWKCAEVVVVSMIIGALGTLPKGLRTWLNVIDMGEELGLHI